MQELVVGRGRPYPPGIAMAAGGDDESRPEQPKRSAPRPAAKRPVRAPMSEATPPAPHARRQVTSLPPTRKLPTGLY